MFGEKGSLSQANFGSYIIHQLPNNLAYFASGGVTGLRTAELGGGSDSGQGDGYAGSGSSFVRFRGAWTDDKDILDLPHLEVEPEAIRQDLLAGDALVDEPISGGMSWGLDDLADRVGYAIALQRHGLTPSANRIIKQFKGSMDRSRWVRNFVQSLQSRVDYWEGSKEILALAEGGEYETAA